MSRIRGKNTSPEMAVRRLLHRMGYRFRLHVRIPITEDLNRRSQRARRSEIRKSFSLRSFAIFCSNSSVQRAQKAKGSKGKDSISKISPIHSSTHPLIRSVCPDIVLPKYKTVISAHGCFWHRHRGIITRLAIIRNQGDFFSAKTEEAVIPIIWSPATPIRLTTLPETGKLVSTSPLSFRTATLPAVSA
jgi:hypothetical protein